MTKQKNTKRSLLVSALVLIMCVSMLVGTTFAWFTDSVTSVNNIIKSGTLDATLEYSNDGASWASVDDTTNVFNDEALYEPGYTEVVFLRVSNVGTLAFKYDLMTSIFEEIASINVYDEEFKLSDYLQVGTYAVQDGDDLDALFGTREAALNTVALENMANVATDIAADGYLLPGENATNTVALVLHMPTTVGNEANHKTGVAAPEIKLGVTLVATQYTYEEDSFDDQYDADATYPNVVSNSEELAAALTAGGEVVLAADVTVSSTLTVSANTDVVINLNGNDLSYAVSNSGASAIINNKGNLNLVGEGTISFVAENPDMQSIPSYATNTITNTGYLTIGEGVVVENGSDGGASYAVDNQGTFVLDGGTLIGDRCALRIAKYNQDNVSFVMNSGLVEAKTPAWIQLPGNNAAVAPTISVEINGGTFKSTKESSADNDVLYTYSFGNSHANTSITINGGEFLGGVVSIGAGYKGDVPTLTINGGTFEYDVMQWLADDGSNVLYQANYN